MLNRRTTELSRAAPRVLVLGLALLLLPSCRCSVGTATSSARLVVNAEVVGIAAGATYVYVVARGDSLALVDAGSDPSGAAILEELGRRKHTPSDVQAVLLTHGHRDSWAAVTQFPLALVVASERDYALLVGDRLPRAPLARLRERLQHKPPPPPQVHMALARELVHAGALEFEVFATPGHTPGSLMYRFGDVLFSGDSLLVEGDALVLAPWTLSDSRAENERSLLRLRGHDIATIVDGRGGVTHDAARLLAALLR